MVSQFTYVQISPREYQTQNEYIQEMVKRLEEAYPLLRKLHNGSEQNDSLKLYQPCNKKKSQAPGYVVVQVARNHYKEMDGIPETPDNSDVKIKIKKKKLL